MVISPNIEIADDFFGDSQDFLRRYMLTVKHFDDNKSRRFKLFIDLRMACECILKAYVANFLMKEKTRKEAIISLKNYGHKIQPMAEDIKNFVAKEILNEFDPYVHQLDKLFVTFRYRVEAIVFREVNEQFYHQTVGSDPWLDALYDVIKKLIDDLNPYLQSHSRIISGTELYSKLINRS